MRSDIAADREMAAETLQAYVDQGLILDQEALKAGLIDVLDYGDALTAKIKKDVTDDPESEDLKFVDIMSYVKNSPVVAKAKVKTHKPKVALIYAVGAIVPHVTNAMAPGVFMGGGNISATDMSMTFNDAIEDEDIGVIVLRLDSPGGSPAASETLRAKILKEKGKVVIVSMGEVAASGGYWMAAPADRIYATPMTLTGSIGVAGGKFVLADLWGKIGVNWEDVSWGENAGMWSPNELYTDSQRARYEAMMDSVYDGFVSRVAEGRKMEVAQAETLARGRVWTGRQAQQNGLVDEIGGLDAALDYAAKLAGAEDRSGVKLEIMPKPETALERLMRLVEMQAGIGQFFTSLMGEWQMAVKADQMMLYEPVTVK
jgi:protease-4